MIFTIFLLVTDLILPIIMLIFGMIFRDNGPKKINSLYGYRTTMSMKNQDTWDFAHRLCGQLWRKWGFVTLSFSLMIGLISLLFNDDVQAFITIILMTAQLVVIIRSIYPVEKALKINFDENGKRRS